MRLAEEQRLRKPCSRNLATVRCQRHYPSPTQHLKKGDRTVGVQRQYTGTAGRIENAQVAVYLTYAAPRGHALIDRELYLPRCWIDDPDRLAEAGCPTTSTSLPNPLWPRACSLVP